MGSLEAVEWGFEDIRELGANCRFANCSHIVEPGCAVRDAVAEERLDQDRLNSYWKQQGEADYVTKQQNKTKALDYMKQWRMFDHD